MDESISFTFNIEKAKKSIISVVLLSSSLFLLLLLTNNKVSRFFEENILFEIYFCAVFLGVMLILVSRLYLYSKAKNNISINNYHISIPNIFLGYKKIYIKEIFSVEYLKLKNAKIAIIIGIKNKSRYMVDKSIFANSEDFSKFYDYIKQRVSNGLEIEVRNVQESISVKQSRNISYGINVLALILALCYVLSAIENNGPRPNENFLLLAANTKDIFQNSEIYRISSSFFFHTRPLHIIINLMVLGLLGPVLNRVFSNIRIINIIFVANLLAVTTSNLFSSFDASIGASGGIFGLWGALACLKLKFERFLPASTNLVPTNRLIFILFAEFYLEIFWLHNVDYFSHLGGLVGGFLYLYFTPLGVNLELIDKPAKIEKYVFCGLVTFYASGLISFFFLYFGLT